MAFTKHGHRIPGSPINGIPPAKARCGGPGVCTKCSSDVVDYHRYQERKVEPESMVSVQAFFEIEPFGVVQQLEMDEKFVAARASDYPENIIYGLNFLATTDI